MLGTLNRRLLEFIAASPSPFHTVDTVSALLEQDGFTPLSAAAPWQLQPGGRYYFTVNGSSLITLRIPEGAPTGFTMSAAHSDSPTFKLKEHPQSTAAGNTYVQLQTERYGGMLMASWLDRPLGVAGRVLVEKQGRIVSRLVHLDQDLAVIPSVAIHMNRAANDGFKYNAAVDTLPLYGVGGDAPSLLALAAENAGVEESDIVGHDLYLTCRSRGTVAGGDDSLLLAPRLDDLGCAFGCLEGFLNADSSDAINVYCLFDNEETGSESKQGAASTLLRDTLRRTAFALGMDEEGYQRLLATSFLVSADNAHAKHPNHPELSDPQNTPVLNGGVVIKYNANQRYTTDGVSAALMRSICRMAEVPVQVFANRSDMAGGSTLGSIANTHVPVRTVDIGLAQLAMHSAYETMGSADLPYLVEAMTTLYGKSLRVDNDGGLYWT